MRHEKDFGNAEQSNTENCVERVAHNKSSNKC